MAERKTERLMNLIFLLLSTRQFLSKEQIRASIPDYQEVSEAAFNRTFERDKATLRELGVPLEVGSFDPLHDDDQGYRIPRAAAELPDLELTAEESAVIGLAAQSWDHADLASQSGAALMKLKAAGVEIDTSALPLAHPRIAASEPAFDAMLAAVQERQPVRFRYGRVGDEPVERHLEPWGVLSWQGRWYVGGHDRDRDAPRIFRLSRVRGEVLPDGQPGDYEPPEQPSVRDLADSFISTEPVGEAVLRVRRDRALPLRRRATSVTPVDDQTDEVRVGYRSSWELASLSAAFAEHVVVVGPDDVRALTVELLERALEVNA
ncbi:MAG: WYL domain-containing protein [Aeromicrobium sp.]|uniref:helix-turn-helix transcriptional regulator n=1 Tax=Aeromicrobium sp. TaxID=1871063 RepID=UPI0039E55D58